MAHHQLGEALYNLGELTLARAHLEQGIALDSPRQGRSRAAKGGYEPRELCLAQAAPVLWHLGYPDQALKRSAEACILAQEAAHSFHLAHALGCATALRLLRGEWQTGQEQAEALVTLAIEQGLPFYVAYGTIQRGCVLIAQGDPKEGMEQIRKGLAAYQATGSEVHRPAFLRLLAWGYGRAGQSEEGLSLLAEALAAVNETGARLYEVGLYRLKGELTLQSQVQSHKSKVEEAEDCFLKAIEIAKKQQARSLELRVTVSLARLWQQQSKKKQARKVLAAIYNWFTEGFDTKDLQEAKALLEELT
jgi:predicted ATPase